MFKLDSSFFNKKSISPDTKDLMKETKNIGLWVLGGLSIFAFLPYVGFILLLTLGIVRLNCKHSRYYKIVRKSIYKSDKRYRTGVKNIGYNEVKEYTKVPITPQDKNINMRIGIIYVILAVLQFLLYYVIFK